MEREVVVYSRKRIGDVCPFIRGLDKSITPITLLLKYVLNDRSKGGLYADI
jgi:hypothetical protein